MKFLIPDGGGTVEKQIILGLKKAGHEAFGCYFRPYGADNDKDAIEKIVEREGIEAVLGSADDSRSCLLEVCTEYGIPLIIWHLDAPYDCFQPLYRRNYGHIYHFCMDRYYINLLRQLGYEKVTYLPLGTTPEIFHPIEGCKMESEVGFVGKLEVVRAKNVWDSITKVWNGKEEDYILIKKLIDVACNPGIDVPATIQAFLQRGLDLSLALRIVHFLETIAVQHRRRKPVEALRDLFTLRVVGDNWRYTNIYRRQICPLLDYYTELPCFYYSSVVNLNVTEPHVKSGLNQRFFDIPACGGFLISDRNEEIEQWFVPGEDIVVYNDIPDLIDKVRYYIDHPEERERIAVSARDKVLRYHTMKHRMEKVVQILENGHE